MCGRIPCWDAAMLTWPAGPSMSAHPESCPSQLHSPPAPVVRTVSRCSMTSGGSCTGCRFCVPTNIHIHESHTHSALSLKSVSNESSSGSHNCTLSMFYRPWQHTNIFMTPQFAITTSCSAASRRSFTVRISDPKCPEASILACRPGGGHCVTSTVNGFGTSIRAHQIAPGPLATTVARPAYNDAIQPMSPSLKSLAAHSAVLTAGDR